MLLPGWARLDSFVEERKFITDLTLGPVSLKSSEGREIKGSTPSHLNSMADTTARDSGGKRGSTSGDSLTSLKKAIVKANPDTPGIYFNVIQKVLGVDLKSLNANIYFLYLRMFTSVQNTVKSGNYVFKRSGGHVLSCTCLPRWYLCFP